MGWWPWSRNRRATFDSPPRPIDEVIADMLGRGSAMRVGRAEALSVPAVQRGRNMICSVATLPLYQQGPDRTRVPYPLLDQLDPDVANVVTLSQTLEDLLFEAVSWWEIIGQDFAGYPTSVRHLDVSTVTTDPPKDRSPAPLPSGIDPRDRVVWVDGRRVPYERIIRFDSPNPAVLKVGARPIRRAILLDMAAAMYADDPRPLDYFMPADGADPASDGDIAQILAEWKAARKARTTGYVPASLKYATVDAPSPQQLQLVELQRQASLDIANALGVDPEDLGVSTTSRTYANAVDRRRDRINDTLSPFMRAITDRLSMPDVTKRGYQVRFDLDDYMRANPTERWATYETAKRIDAITVEEIREEEGRPPMPETTEAEAPPLAAVVPMPDAVTASRAAAHNFDEPTTFSLDTPVVQFSVDRDNRIIEGLTLPYGKVGSKEGVKFSFDQGALQWAADDPGRVKLVFPRHGDAIGKAIQLSDTPGGLLARFKVGRGAEGDRALELAEDGVYDGLSVGIDFDARRDAKPHPQDRTVMLVHRADLRHVALTDAPVFDDARVTRVAASRDNQGGPAVADTATTEPVTAPETPAAPAAPATPAAPVTQTFSADQVRQLLAQATAPVVEEPRPTVDPTRSLSLSVTEPAPYRFDRKGNLHPGAHEFSADIISGLRDGDTAAYDRAMSFIRAQFDVVTTDVNELNPVTNRPDMYVDQRAFRYPVWDAINKGTLAVITPFTFPKFSSASGLVGAHTEGTEPSSGTFVATNQTVTPAAISGKAKISRETWDQGGNPQIGNLIWRQMEKGWFEALEAAAVAVLDAATPTAIALTAGFADTGQTQALELKAAMAALQFVRGGFSMTDAFTQIDLYKALVAARDENGRPLFPAIGPSNADGTVSNRVQSVDVNGVPFLPAWALAATGVVVASSYLFDRESVHGWASAPQRLTIDMTEVANVYIGLWGYRATAISDIAGVREITYDPVA